MLERATYPRHKPCAEYMSPGVVHELYRLGVGARVEAAAGARLDGFTLYTPGHSFTGRFPAMPADRRAAPPAPDLAPSRATDPSPTINAERYSRDRTSLYVTEGTPTADCRPHGLGIARATLDHILAETAGEVGVEVWTGARATDLVREGRRVVGVQVRRGTETITLHAPLVIGADGIRSVVASRLGALEPRRDMERIALVAHVAGIQGLHARGEMHITSGGYCGIAPLGEGVANVAMVHRNAVDQIAGRTEAFFWDVLRVLPTLRGRITTARIVRPILATGSVSYRARLLSTDGALLVGDAGGYYDPFTGQGVHRALRTAELAADVALSALAAGDTSHDRLRAYDARRRAAFREAHAVEWLVQQFIGRPALFARAARRLAANQTMADTLVGVTGDIVPPRRVLSPWFLGRLAI